MRVPGQCNPAWEMACSFLAGLKGILLTPTGTQGLFEVETQGTSPLLSFYGHLLIFLHLCFPYLSSQALTVYMLNNSFKQAECPGVAGFSGCFAIHCINPWLQGI